MLYISDIEKIINDTLNKHNLDIIYEFNNNLTVPMSYNVSTNTIKFNYLQVNGYIREKLELKRQRKTLLKLFFIM